MDKQIDELKQKNWVTIRYFQKEVMCRVDTRINHKAKMLACAFGNSMQEVVNDVYLKIKEGE